MIPELGHFALILALLFTLIQATIPLIGVAEGRLDLMVVAKSCAWVQWLLFVIAFACLVYAFVNNDFTVAYVAKHSNSLLPLQYKISAVWGGHEGSILLWALILSSWTVAVAIFSQRLPATMVASVLTVMAWISLGFLLFILFTSNPFERLLPNFPIDGQDLNPLLQDFGLIVHPPILYMGYVGFSVVFAFAIAALLEGRLDSAWARWCRPWTLVAWCFLTLGISLGSWWAYYELGWGGWWFWDPVENASFMPWLAGTALLHSLAATEKRGVFKSWTLLLAISAFSFSLLGTFLVRSGVLTSVHAFANDPERGSFILIFLSLVVGGSLTLFAIRAGQFKSFSQYDLASKEMLLLGNNLLLSVATAVVMLGTLFPLFADIFHWGKISVGPPYFNALFIPLVLGLLFLLGFVPLMRWRQNDLSLLVKQALPSLIASLIIAVLLPWWLAEQLNIWVVLALFMVFWVLSRLVFDLKQKLQHKRHPWQAMLNMTPSYWGMSLAHFGVLVLVVGAALTSVYSIEKDVRLDIGGSVSIADYEFRLIQLKDIQGSNYTAVQADIEVYQQQRFVTKLFPEKRLYSVQKMPMTEAAIDPGLTRDLYISLGEPLDGNSWAVRVYYKPFVRWLWLGGVLMAFGGLIVIRDRRYRFAIKSTKSSQSDGLFAGETS